MKAEKRNIYEYFGIKLSPRKWLIEDRDFGLDYQHVQETLFSLGNGFIGSRGVFEELPERALPGTFISGVYDRSGAQVEELVNLPNPINFFLLSEGEKIDMFLMRPIKHVRFLDMNKGLLARNSVFKDGKKRKFIYRSLRFFSLDNPHIGAMKVSVTLLNGTSDMTSLDFLNEAENTGGLMYGTRKHYRLKEFLSRENEHYRAYQTHTTRTWIAYADQFEVEIKGKKTVLEDRVFNFRINEGETVTFTKIFSVLSSLETSKKRLRKETLGNLEKAVKTGFNGLIEAHLEKWKEKWRQADIAVEGDSSSEKALRFNIYHLLIAHTKYNLLGSIGARALTGQGYRGHVFWDSEIFMLPFYLYNFPELARKMLIYRYERMDEARKIARHKGYNGVLFPWESGSSGNDVTPRYAKDVNGSYAEINTMDYEHHISADVAFGVYDYLRATGDYNFQLDYGAEIVFETARFWASRAVSGKGGKYEINEVIGPDEFHIKVNNNAFTNLMAAWNMEYASYLFYELQKNSPDKLKEITGKIDINKEETDRWINISRNIFVPISKSGIIEEFEGYFNKKERKIKTYSRNFMPEAPKLKSYADYDQYKFVKQADTLLLMYLLPERFSRREILRNYTYYIARTLHQSSLSHSTHALLAAKLCDRPRAYAFFRFAANVDLKNLHKNSDGGMHMASAGGVWQAAIKGFAGIGFDRNAIRIEPRLPGNWKKMKFKLVWKNNVMGFTVTHNSVTARLINSDKDSEVFLESFDKKYILSKGKSDKVRIIVKEEHMKKVGDVMEKEKIAAVRENTPIKNISRIMTEDETASVAVVGKENDYLGVVFERDVLKAFEEGGYGRLKAADLMRETAPVLKESDSIEEAVKKFEDIPQESLPVLKNKKLVGVLERRKVLAVCIGEYY